VGSSISQLPDHVRLPEPDLAFHPDRATDRDQHPLRGLDRYGPFSRSLIGGVLDPIRLAAVVPAGMEGGVRALIAELEGEAAPRERLDYLIKFRGFSRVFGVRAVLTDVVVSLPVNANDRLKASATPHRDLAEMLTGALGALDARRGEFDVALVLLPEKWSSGFYGPEGDDFDLHDYLKAVSATRGIPVQILREGSALAYPCRASVMWRIGIALYVKAGGVPWKLADPDPEMAFIGLSYAMAQRDSGPQFITCCSQVFDAEGAGLEFIAYETADAAVIRGNPFLSRVEMRRVISRSLVLYQRRHGGRSPMKLVVHKSTEFKREEVDGCFDAWPATSGLELVQVQQDSSWRGILLEPVKGAKSTPAAYPCDRGTVLQLGGRDILLWTQGNATEVLGGRNYYKEGKGIPSPLVLTRWAGHGPWNDGAKWVLGLSKMDWNNDALYDRLPVTMSYASVLARTIKRMPSISPRAYAFRFFM
jgi:hypothetical protein